MQTYTQHSTVEKKAAVTVQMGEGDHTWIETYAVDREDLRKIEEAEKNFRKQLIEDESTLEVVSTDADDDTKTLNDFDLEDPERKKNFFNYVDKTYSAKTERKLRFGRHQ